MTDNRLCVWEDGGGGGGGGVFKTVLLRHGFMKKNVWSGSI